MTKRETAERLAQAHFRVDPNLRRVFLLEPVEAHDATEPIALLEVVEGTLERGLEPIAFADDPRHGVDYPSVVLEVSPKEFEDLKFDESGLGARGWRIGEEVPRPGTVGS